MSPSVDVSDDSEDSEGSSEEDSELESSGTLVSLLSSLLVSSEVVSLGLGDGDGLGEGEGLGLGDEGAASFTVLMAFWTSLQLPALFMALASLSLASWVVRAFIALS